MSYFGFRSVISIAAKACNSVSRRGLFRFSAALITLNALSRELTLADACLPDTAGSKLFKVALEYNEDKYEGVIVDEQRLPRTRADFSSQLLHSLETWRATGKKGVWLKIPIDKLEYAATAIDLGFVCHHAEKDYLMLTHWLSKDENKLPPNASHQIGVGCVVVNQEGKLLAVQEKCGPLKGTGFWKIPTGLVDSSEDLHIAACREVLEETGIETEFVGLLCFRHAHNFQFGKSDLFFVCLLKPISYNIVKQDSEIAACEWLELDTYMTQALTASSPLYSKLNSFIEKIVKDSGSKNFLERHTLPLGNRPGSNTLYLPMETVEIKDSIN